MKGRARVAVWSGGILGLWVATVWSLTLGYVDWLAAANTPAALREAVRLAPGDVRYRTWLADLVDADGGDPTPLLKDAARVDPMSASAWIQLGLRMEMQGDLPTAERHLLRAAEVSRQYRPRWTLANYYFRRGQADQFWRWTREALQTDYPDPMPLFRLSWALDPDPDLILQRAIPDQHPVLVKYLLFLTREHRMAEAEAVVRKATEQIAPADQTLLLEACERLVTARRLSSALQIWNSLCEHGAMPYRTLRPEQGVSLTNGGFKIKLAPAGFVGFDWRVDAVPGVVVVADEVAGTLRVEFSGQQPETCEPVAQWMPLQPRRKYRFSFEFQTADIAPGSGLGWRLQDLDGEIELLRHSDFSSSPDWTRQELEFSTQPQTQFAKLVLHYERPSGTTRIKGSLALRNLSLRFSE